MIVADNKFVPLAQLIDESIRGCPKMQKILYQHFAPKMYTVCFRYAKNAEDAEDILQEGFIKVFRNLHKYRGEGSFEGWIRTIMTRTAISHLNDPARKFKMVDAEILHSVKDHEISVNDRLDEKDIAGLVKRLTPGYQKVFIMYVMEGYNHKEIADILGCSEGNSKSQLFRSRIQLQKMLKKTA
ncbi:MAG: RNA polymerase sigma factor [Ferruginibacter sp.]